MTEETLLILIVILLVLLLIFIIRLSFSRRFEVTLKDSQIDTIQKVNHQHNDLIDRIDVRFDSFYDQNMEQMNLLKNRMELISKDLVEGYSQYQHQLNLQLNANLKHTDGTFNTVLERLVKISEAQKKVDTLSTDISSLQSVLTNKQARGLFGEIQLQQILSSVFGDSNHNLYKLQYTLSTGARVDAILFAPEPLGTLAIDSKFPLDNYRRIHDVELNDFEREKAKRLFVQDVKRHIDAIANKYIIDGETSHQALLFIPAEAVFSYIHGYHYELVTYSLEKSVWLVSPTTMMATLTMIQTLLRNIEQSQYTKEIHQHLKDLNLEFVRYQKRWDQLSRHFDTINKDVKEIHTTSQKISKTFERINTVEIEDKNIE